MKEFLIMFYHLSFLLKFKSDNQYFIKSVIYKLFGSVFKFATVAVTNCFCWPANRGSTKIF